MALRFGRRRAAADAVLEQGERDHLPRHLLRCTASYRSNRPRDLACFPRVAELGKGLGSGDAEWKHVTCLHSDPSLVSQLWDRLT